MAAVLLKCVDVASLPGGTGPNPLSLAGVTFLVRGPGGVPLANSTIKNQGTFHGLDAGFSLEALFRKPVSAVCLSLAHWAKAPTVRCFSPAGTLVGQVTVASTQNVAQSVVCSSKAIAQVVITAPSDETLLLDLCFG